MFSHDRFMSRVGVLSFKPFFDQYRLVDIESRAYQGVSDWKKFLTSYKERGFGIWFADGTIQTYDINHETTTNMDINKIKIYVTDDKWFLSDLSPYTITNTLSRMC